MREAKIAVRKDTREGTREAFKGCSGPREMWSTAKRVLGMSKDKGPTTISNKHGDLTSNPGEMAEEFNDYFISKIKNLRATAVAASEGQEDPLESVRRKMASRELPEVSSLRRITKMELRRIMGQVKPGRSAGSESFRPSYPPIWPPIR